MVLLQPQSYPTTNADCRCKATTPLLGKVGRDDKTPRSRSQSHRCTVFFVPTTAFFISAIGVSTYRQDVSPCRPRKRGRGDRSAAPSSAAIDAAGAGDHLTSVGDAAPFALGEIFSDISETSLMLILGNQKQVSTPLAPASDRLASGRSRNKVVVTDEAGGPNPPIIINNYVGADSGDSEDDRSRPRNRRQWRRFRDAEDDSYESEVDVRRSHRPGRRYSPVRVPSSASEDEDSDDLYNFTPSYASVSSESRTTRPSSVDSSKPFLPTIGASPLRTAKTMHVYKAQYVGDGCPEGNHGARLTLLHEPRHPQQALFRWM